MIQRKQSLFLLELIFLSIVLFFLPVASAITKTTTESIHLMPIHSTEITSTTIHFAAIGLNSLLLLLTLMTLFLYKNRQLQIKLCYAIAALWILLSVMITACPFVVKTDTVKETHTNFIGVIIGAIAVLSAILAARLIKKDVELLKSAERIR